MWAVCANGGRIGSFSFDGQQGGEQQQLLLPGAGVVEVRGLEEEEDASEKDREKV